MMKKKTSAVKVATFGVLLATALLLGYVESLFPYDFAVPGIKLGLPNMITLIVLRKKGMPSALTFGLLRAALSNLLFGSAVSLAYAAAGCVVSVAAMGLVGKIKVFGVPGQSVMGAIGHNLGQIAAAAVILGTWRIVYYLPFLMIAGCVAGFAVGVGAAVAMEKGKRWLKI